MIKKKISQIVKFTRLLNTPNATKFMTKLKKENIYLFFATPVIEDNIKNFIINKDFLMPNRWSDNQKYGITLNDILFFSIKLVLLKKMVMMYQLFMTFNNIF